MERVDGMNVLQRILDHSSACMRRLTDEAVKAIKEQRDKIIALELEVEHLKMSRDTLAAELREEIGAGADNYCETCENAGVVPCVYRGLPFYKDCPDCGLPPIKRGNKNARKI